MKFLLDIPKENGNPVLNLPASVSLKRRANRFLLRHETKGTCHALLLWQNATRWVAFVVAPPKAAQWFEEHFGADVYPLNHASWQARKAQLAVVGLVGEMRNGVEVLRAPHTICGKSPYIYPEE